jgi:hypothetical protein
LIITPTPCALEHIVDGAGNLRCHLLVNLQALGTNVDYPSQLGNADHAAIWDVGDPGVADDWRHVVLATPFEANVPQYDHFVIPFDLLEDLFQNLGRVLAVSRETLLERTGYTSWRFDQAISIGVFSGPSDDGSHRRFDFRSVRPLSFSLRPSLVQQMRIWAHRYTLLDRSRCSACLTCSRPLDDP